MARRFSSVRRGKSSRRSDWISLPPLTAYEAVAGATSVIEGALITTVPITIVRIVGVMSVQSDQAAASERPFGAVGAAVVSDQAAGIGVTAVPTPYTNADSDLWMQHQFWAAPVAEAGTGASLANISDRVDLSSKAMRKLTPDEQLLFVVENGSATHGMEFILDVRVLYKFT